MSTVDAAPASRFDHLAQQRRLDEALRTLHARGWEERLQPLATHMAAQRLVRARGYAGGPARQIDREVLRAALCSLLRRKWDQGHLIVQLVVQGLEPAQVATERGIGRPALVEMLREAIGALATEYEEEAYATVGQSPQEQMQARLAGVAKRQ
jgi:hypothetical protein